MNWSIPVIFVVTVLYILAATVDSGIAIDEEPVVGDRVKFEHKDRILTGEVTAISKLTITIRYVDERGREYNRPFARRSIRYEIQKFDLPKMDLRAWTSSDGQHKIQATLVGLTPTTAQLKNEDGKTVSVGIDKLSKADQEFLAQFLNDDNQNAKDNDKHSNNTNPNDNGQIGSSSPAPEIAEPNPDHFNEPDISEIKEFSGDFERPLVLEPVERQVSQLVEKNISVGLATRLRRIQQTIFHPSGDFALVSYTCSSGNPSIVMEVLDLKSGKSLGPQGIKLDDVEPVDISPNGKRLLTTTKNVRGGRLDVWELTGPGLTHLVGWKIPKIKKFSNLRSGFASNDQKIEMAAFVDNGKVVTMNSSHRVHVMELEPLKAIFQIDLNELNYGKSSYALSPDRRKLFYCQRTEVRALDLASGSSIGAFDVGGQKIRSISAVAISPDHSKFAVIVGGLVKILDNRGSIVDEFPIPMPLAFTRLRWIDDRFLIDEGSSLTVIDTKYHVSLWRYECSAFTPVRIGVFGNAWMAHTQGNRLILSKIKVPHQAALARLPADPDSLLIFKQGDRVKLEFDEIYDGNTKQAVRQVLADKLNERGATLDEDADLAIFVGQKEVTFSGSLAGKRNVPIKTQGLVFDVSMNGKVIYSNSYNAAFKQRMKMPVRRTHDASFYADWTKQFIFAKNVAQQSPDGVIGNSTLSGGKVAD